MDKTILWTSGRFWKIAPPKLCAKTNTYSPRCSAGLATLTLWSWETQRALRLKKFNPDWSREMFNPYAWKLQSRLEIFNLDWNFNPDLDITPQTEALISFALEIFNLDWNFQSEIGRLKISIQKGNLEFFQSLGPLGMVHIGLLRWLQKDSLRVV